MAKRRKKSRWLERLDLLKSLELTALAKEIGGTSRTAKRMKRLLIALHQIIQEEAEYVIPIERIAEEMVAGRNTAKRAIADADALSLIAVTERPKAKHGQGANAYRLAWSNLKNVAFDQGLQLALFDDAVFEEPHEDSAAESAEGTMSAMEVAPPEIPSGSCRQDADNPTGPAQTPTGPAQTPTGPAQTPTGPAQTPTGPALYKTRVRAIPLSPQESPEESPSFPERGEGDSDLGQAGTWDSLNARLAEYGLSVTRKPIEAALANGWIPQQIAELLDACERATIAGVRAWGPGAVYTHLCVAEPGTKIRLPPSEAYRRARRDQDISQGVWNGQPKTAEERQAAWDAAFG